MLGLNIPFSGRVEKTNISQSGRSQSTASGTMRAWRPICCQNRLRARDGLRGVSLMFAPVPPTC